MAILREWLRRLIGTVARTRRDRELEDELRSHVEMAADDLQKRGRSPDEAYRAARLDAGGIAPAIDALRDQRGLPWLDDLARDVRHATRSLRRTPAFTTVALVTLALGIGANTAIFSIVNGVILRPLPYPKPEKLMHLTTRLPALGLTEFWLSAPEYIAFRDINQSFAHVGAYRTGEVNVSTADRALRARSAFVDEHLLAALGVQPAHGRFFLQGESDAIGTARQGEPSPQPAPVVILSHELWQSAFGGRDVISDMIDVHGRRREIVGIMPPAADVMDYQAEIWMPLGITEENRGSGNHFLYAIGRLKDDVAPQAAQAEIDALMRNWHERTGSQGQHGFLPADHQHAHLLEMAPLQDAIIGPANRAIWTLQAAVALVLVIACANLATLLLARAETRRRELAVRAALGATRSRLVRQFMTEGVLLSLAGGALGLVLAHASIDGLLRAYPTSLPRTHDVAIDPTVLLYTSAVSFITGLLFGIAPTLRMRLIGLMPALKASATRGAAGATRHRVRFGLVTLEVALAVVLVIGAGLLVRTVQNLTSVDGGFDRGRLVTFLLTLPNFDYPDPGDRAEMFRRLLEELRVIPGVQSATAMSGLPPERPAQRWNVDVDNYTPQTDGPFEIVDYYQAVMADYFETMGVPIVQGRGFERADAAAPGPVAVVNETFVNTFWRDRNPIGQRLRPSTRLPWFTVIGIAKDVKQGGIDRPAGTEVYFFVAQTGHKGFINMFGAGAPGTMNVVLRTTLPSSALSATIARLVRQTDPRIPVVRLREMEEAFAESIQRPRLLAQLLGAFAGLALLLAAVGIYGLLTHIVAERRREIGVRIALGAARTIVLGQMLKQGLLLVAAGIAIGIAGAFGLNRLIASLLFGVRPTDGATIAAVVATIVLVAAVACGLPAWRASRLDPAVVLRDE